MCSPSNLVLHSNSPFLVTTVNVEPSFVTLIFFAGAQLLSVDQSLVDAGKMFFSRDVAQIMQYLEHAKDSFFEYRAGGIAGLERCKQVQQEILDVLDQQIRAYLKSQN